MDINNKGNIEDIIKFFLLIGLLYITKKSKYFLLKPTQSSSSLKFPGKVKMCKRIWSGITIIKDITKKPKKQNAECTNLLW